MDQHPEGRIGVLQRGALPREESTVKSRPTRSPRKSSDTERCRRKFLRFFPKGFQDNTYLDWERNYKWEAHERWNEVLNQTAFQTLLDAGEFSGIAARAVRIESRTNLLFSFEKMALRGAVKSLDGARSFATGLHALLHGEGGDREKFERWCDVVGQLRCAL